VQMLATTLFSTYLVDTWTGAHNFGDIDTYYTQRTMKCTPRETIVSILERPASRWNIDCTGKYNTF
jgi:hypothetical protein